MSGLLTLDVSPGTSALERLISVVRRRGFQVDALQAFRSGEDRSCLSVELCVSGDRDVALLGRHLSNLGDCRQVVVSDNRTSADLIVGVASDGGAQS